MTAHSPFSPRPASFDGFVHAQDAKLLDGAGRELLLRGVGLGNWMLPEGYMWKFGPGAESPREIEALFDALVGPERAGRFWAAFRETFITEHDIAAIAASGFDHVRLPINSRVVQDEHGEPIEAGYAMIDRLIQWCRKHRLWVLLDLHGAPGGQTGTNIDDSPNNLPELFMQPRYRELTLRLWRDLATRYAGETVVLGYDLLNEPLPNEWQHTYADELARLYRDLTAVIREVDADHLIVYEGSHWATNWGIFTEVWDDNSLLQFHKYWSSPDTASIQQFLDVRERLGLPIYMGEGGENTLEWLYTAFRLYESHGIGWNLWPWKKIETVTSPVSIVAPDGWDELIAAISERDAITPGRAWTVLEGLLAALPTDASRWRPDVVSAVTGVAPSVVPAWGFGFRGRGESYQTRAGRPMPGIREGDDVSLAWAYPGEHDPNPFQQSDGRAYRDDEVLVAELAAGDWLEFEMEGVDAATTTVHDAAGAPVACAVELTPRGIRITAQADVRVATLRPGHAD